MWYFDFLGWVATTIGPTSWFVGVVGTPVISLWLIVLLARNRPGSDSLAYGLIKALYLVGLLAAVRDLCFSYFCLCSSGGHHFSMGMLSVSRALESFMLRMILCFGFLIAASLRFRVRPQLSVIGSIGIVAGTVALGIHLFTRAIFYML